MPPFGRNEPKPDWAASLSRLDYSSLKSTIEELLDSKGLKFSWDEPTGIRIELSEDEYAIAALYRLADRYRFEEIPAVRTALVHDHFASLIDPPQWPMTWGEAQELVRPALFSADAFDETPDFARVIADGVVAVTALGSYEEGVRSISDERAAAWGVSLDIVWERALANVHSDPLIREERTPLAEGAEVHAFFGATRFGAARALQLERYLDGHAPDGALLVVPSGSELVFHEIDRSHPMRLAAARDFLLKVGPTLFLAETIDPVSPHVFWVRSGAWQRVTEIVDDSLAWMPPGDLAALEGPG
jgi:hypothetical protein